MSASFAQRAGDALIWKAIQVGGTRGLFFVRTLILATLLGPADFGLFAIAVSAIGVLMTTTELGMVPALVQRQEAEDSHYDGAWTVGVMRALGVSAVLVIAAPAIADLFAEPRAAALLRVLAAKPLIDATASIRIVALLRGLNYRRVAMVSLAGAVAETGVSIALAPAFAVWALVIGTLAGGVTSVVFSYVLAPYRPRIVLDTHAVRPLIRYGRWVLLTAVVAVSTNWLTQVVISRQLGAFDLGLYFLATKLAFAPYELAAQMLGEVAFPLFARVQSDRMLVATGFRSILLGMVTVLLPVYVLVISLAPWFVQDVLGERWRGTEPLIQVLGLAGLIGLFGELCVPLFRGVGHPKWVVGLELVQSGLVVALLWTAIGRYGAVGAALAWLTGIAVSQSLHFWGARRLLDDPLAGVLRPVALVSAVSLVGAATALAVRQLVGGPAGFAIAVPLASVTTVMLMWACDRRFNLGLGSVLVRTFPRFAELTSFMPGR
jgi:O-antigen/teichoic acid export membrane protein